MARGMGALSRAVGIAWRRSLQLRVVALTLGLSLAVILALGFVLTSQLTNRVLDVKVRAAIEQIERARTTVGGIVNGEETRSLDSSLQLARNTLTSKSDPAWDAGLGAGGQPGAVSDLSPEERGSHSKAGARNNGHRRRGTAGPALGYRAAGLPPGCRAGAVGVAHCRTVRRGASVRTNAGTR